MRDRRLTVVLLATTSVWCSGSSLLAQCSGFPVGGILNGILNTYYPAPDTAATVTAAAGATCIRVDNAARQGSATLVAAGELLLVVQMQGGTINSANTECYGDSSDEAPAGCVGNNTTSGDGSGTTARTAGTYEYVLATSAVSLAVANACGSGVVADRVFIAGGGAGGGLVNSYTNARTSGATGQQTYQVIRVPQYQSAQVGNSGGTATVSAFAWNGRSGGVVAFDVAGTLTVQVNSGATPAPAIDASGAGFRGGVAVTAGGTGSGTPNDFDYRQLSTFAVHANKAEGIAGTPASLTGLTVAGQGYENGDRARGAPGNAGGGGSDGNVAANDQNSGGGGGGNGDKGGRGGQAWNSGEFLGGYGGVAYTAAANSLIMGGGGGGGSNNNNAGKSGGAAGGGIVLVRANTVTGTATFSANGNAAPDLEASAGGTNDAGGGGGGGGTLVVLAATALPATLTLNANGGFGANANAGAACVSDAHGPGGGGAGGVIFTSDVNPTRNRNGVNGGLTNSVGAVGCDCPTPPVTKVPAGTCISYGATAGALGQVLTGTINSLPGVRTCVTATRATLSGLRVSSGGVEFATASERGALAFNLYESDGAGPSVRLNAAPLPARGRGGVGTTLYRVETGPLTKPFVFVEEIESSGRRRRLGPFAASDETLAAGFAAAERQVERTEATHEAGLLRRSMKASHPTAVARPLLGPARARVSAVKVATRGRGSVEVAVADLLALGVEPRLMRGPASPRVYNLGRPVPASVNRDTTGAPISFRFLAEPLGTDYTGENAYVLSFLPGPPRVPTVPLTRSGFPREASTVRVEEDAFYVPFVAPPADPWLWGLVFEDMGPASFPFDLRGLVSAASSVTVRIGLVGANEPAHAVEATLNGVALGEVRFTGAVAAELRAEVPAGALSATGNVLTLRYTSDDPSGYAFLDVLDLGVAADLDPRASVARLEAYDSGLESLAGVQYLVLSHPQFLEAANRVARAKRASGLTTRVVDVTRAYDRHSGGVFEANAIGALLREARRQSPRLKYVLLVGDDTFDPRDRLGLGQVSYLPSVMAWDGQFGRVPSETAYADTDGDGAPDLAIGRLPVGSPEEARLLAEKIEKQDDLLRPGRGRHLLASDDAGVDDVSFRAEADRVGALLPPGAQRLFVDVGHGLEAARAALLAGMREGAVVTHYFGHGGPEQWADERLLDTGTAQALVGAGRASLVLAWACESDWYQYHLGRSLGEELLLLPDGGSVASFGPSGITDPRAQAVLQKHLYPLLLQGLPVGEAVRRAKATVVREEPWARPVVNGFSLLGDPALVPISARP